jgi:hypothetical protein
MLLPSKLPQTFRSFKLVTLQIKLFSTQVDPQLDNAKPYEQIPGPKGIFEVLRLMGPGGKYYKFALDEMVASFKEDYGTLCKFPGFLGQKQLVMTYLPEDIEQVFRLQGKTPFRRVLDSVEYFRKKQRPDLYPAGAGLTIT